MSKKKLIGIIVGVVCIIVIIVIVVALRPPEDNSASDTFGIQLVQLGEAKIETPDYAGRSLTGVVLHIEYPTAGIAATFEASSVFAERSNGELVPAELIFVINTNVDIQEGTFLGGTVVRGLNIFIGEDEFHCWGSPARMALDITKGGFMLTLAERGKAEIGFIFPERVNNLVNLTVLDKTIELQWAPSQPVIKGQVEGCLIYRDSGQPIEDGLVVLCKIVDDLKCRFQSRLQAFTDDTGSFIISDVPKGSYTAAFAKPDMVPKVNFADGELLDYEELWAGAPLPVIAWGDKVDESYLIFQVEYGAPRSFEVKGNETTYIEVLSPP